MIELNLSLQAAEFNPTLNMRYERMRNDIMELPQECPHLQRANDVRSHNLPIAVNKYVDTLNHIQKHLQHTK